MEFASNLEKADGGVLKTVSELARAIAAKEAQVADLDRQLKAQIKGDNSTAMPRMINFLARITRTHQMVLAHMDHSMFGVLKTSQAQRPKISR